MNGQLDGFDYLQIGRSEARILTGASCQRPRLAEVLRLLGEIDNRRVFVTFKKKPICLIGRRSDFVADDPEQKI